MDNLLDLFDTLGPTKKMDWGFVEAATFTGITERSGGWVDLNFVADGGTARKMTAEPETVFDDVEAKENLVKAVEPFIEVLKVIIPEQARAQYFDIKLDDFQSVKDSVKQGLHSYVADGHEFSKVNLKVLPGGETFQYRNFPRYGGWIEPHIAGIPHSFSYTDWELDNLINPAQEYERKEKDSSPAPTLNDPLAN